MIHEDSEHCYPYQRHSHFVPGMGESLTDEISSVFLNNGIQDFPENFFELTPEELTKREIVYLDILDGHDPEYPEFNLHGFTCPQLNEYIFPGSKGESDSSKIPKWTETYHGDISMIIRLYKFEFKWFGLQTFVEHFICSNVTHMALLDTSRSMVKWIPDWDGKTIEEIKEYETSFDSKNKDQEFKDVD